MRPVLGAQNPRIVELRRLLGRRNSRSGQVLIEGPRLVAEMLDAGHVPSLLIVPESGEQDGPVSPILERVDELTEILVVRDHVFERLAPTVSPQPMLAVAERPVAEIPDDPRVVLVLIGVSDPGNLGTLVRAADAAAVDAVVVVGGADPWGPKSVRSSAGSLLRVPVVQLDDASEALAQLRSAGLRLVGTDVRQGEPFDQGVLEPPVAVIVGSEPHGLDPELDLDGWAHISMPGRTESLNVAMAGTLLVYEATRRS